MAHYLQRLSQINSIQVRQTPHKRLFHHEARKHQESNFPEAACLGDKHKEIERHMHTMHVQAVVPAAPLMFKHSKHHHTALASHEKSIGQRGALTFQTCHFSTRILNGLSTIGAEVCKPQWLKVGNMMHAWNP